jgi:hypothetical protein
MLLLSYGMEEQGTAAKFLAAAKILLFSTTSKL